MWLVSPDVRSTYSEDGAVLLEISKGLCYSLNAVAARVWAVMESSKEGVTLPSVVDSLEIEFKIPRTQLEGDAAEWLEKLARLGLVHENGEVKSRSAASEKS